MTRIIRTAYRHKRPSGKRKPVALEVPAVIVNGKNSRRPADSQVAAEVALVPRMRDGAMKSTTAVDAPRDRPVTGGGKPKLSIVTARRPRAVNLPPGLLAETLEEHRRRGDAADALWRELVRRIAGKT
jgi:hypothetical protein